MSARDNWTKANHGSLLRPSDYEGQAGIKSQQTTEQCESEYIVKYTDDYNAKLKIWAKEGKVYAIPRIANLPRFGWKKFKSHEERSRVDKDQD